MVRFASFESLGVMAVVAVTACSGPDVTRASPGGEATVAGAESALESDAPQATGATLNVASDGVDSPTCGGAGHACRSISRAVANAHPGDTISVGPGRYGDLNGNGVLGEPGEETPSNYCMVWIDLRLTILSTAGALRTVIDAGGAPYCVVGIHADTTVFGAPQHGFTITGSGNGIEGFRALASHQTVRGNLFRNNGLDGLASFGYANLIARNVAVGNGQCGFAIHGSDHVVRRNTSQSNLAIGFCVDGLGHELTNDSAVGNAWDGFAFTSGHHVLEQSEAIGNGSAGVNVPGAEETTVTVHDTNLFGNDDDPMNTVNCGIVVGTNGVVDARNDYWGAPTGPGANPADAICSTGPVVPSVPFATTPFDVAGAGSAL